MRFAGYDPSDHGRPNILEYIRNSRKTQASGDQGNTPTITLQDLLNMIPGFTQVDYRPILDKYLASQRASLASQLAVNQAQLGQALLVRGLSGSGVSADANAILGSRIASAVTQAASQAIPAFARLDIAQRQFLSQLGSTRAKLASQWLQFQKQYELEREGLRYRKEQAQQEMLANLFNTLFQGGVGIFTTLKLLPLLS